MSNERSDSSRISDPGLIEDIVRFSHLLRDHGISVSLPAVLSAIDGLPLIDIFSLSEFQCLLRVNFVCRKEDLPKYDRLFYRYWRAHKPAPLKIFSVDAGSGTEPPEAGACLKETATNAFGPGGDAAKAAEEWTLRYSPEPLAKPGETKELHFAESGAFYDSISKLLRPLTRRMSRRSQYTIRGKEIDLRRILRRNMQFGGELILLDYKRKKLKRSRVIFFCDVSGSMDVYTLMILQFIHALRRIDRRTEIFFFSTDLSRATMHFDAGDFPSVVSKLPEFVSDWGGGTRIGHCLKRFREIYGQHLLSSKAIVMIFSDGWDRGETDVLDAQMAFFKQKVYKIIWLNPLLATDGYQPICRGMSAALPYLDYFLPMGDPRDLLLLSRTIEKMII